MSRIIKFLVIILVIIIVCELGYYLYVQVNEQKIIFCEKTNTTEDQLSIVPQPTIDLKQLKKDTVFSDYVDRVRKLGKSKLILEVATRGYINYVKVDEDDPKDILHFSIADEQGNKLLERSVSPSEVEKSYILLNGRKSPLSLKSLKEGMLVNYVERKDLVSFTDDEYIFEL